MMVISLVVSQLLHLFFSEKNSGIEPKDQQHFKVILQQGVVGCIAQDKFDLVQKLYSQNDVVEIKKILNNKECFVFVKDEEFSGPKTNCDEKSKITDSFTFSSKKFQLTKIVLPCFAFKTI
jgi:hypothetical protein